MAIDIGPRIGIDGEAEFRRSIQQISQSLKTMDAESKALTATMQDETDAEKKNAAQKELLERQINAQRAGIEKLQKGLQDSAAAFGEEDTRTQKWQQALYKATADLANMAHQLNSTEGEVKDTGAAMQEAEGKTRSWSDVLKGNLLSDVIKSGFQALVNIAKEAAKAMKDCALGGMEYADSINTLYKQTNLSTETLQEFQYMEKLIDVSTDTITGSLSKLTKNMSSARKGTGDAAAAFQELGIEIVDENGKLRKAEDVFNDAIDALGKVKNETERDAKAMAIFGKSAKELNPLIKAGSGELNKLKQAAHDSGYVLGNSSLKALQKAQDAMDSLSKAAEGTKNKFSVGLAPGVEKAAKTMESALNNPRTQRGITVLSEGLGDILGFVADLGGKAIPAFLTVLGVGDTRLRTYTDAEIALANSIDDTATKWKDLTDTFTETAKEIEAETSRTQDLWAELQTLADKEGNVKDADKTRADFILNELNEALGTEYAMNENQIQQYQEMVSEIEHLIEVKKAEALLSANRDNYSQALADNVVATQQAASAYAALIEGQNKLKAAEKERNEARAAYAKDEIGNLGRLSNAEREYSKAFQKLTPLQEDYSKALASKEKIQRTINTFEAAEAAVLQQNYELAAKLLTQEVALDLERVKSREAMSEQEISEFHAKIREKEAALDALKLYYAKTGDETVAKLIAQYEQELAEAKAAIEERERVETDALGRIEATRSKAETEQRQQLEQELRNFRIAIAQKSAEYLEYKKKYDAGVEGTSQQELDHLAEELQAFKDGYEQKKKELASFQAAHREAAEAGTKVLQDEAEKAGEAGEDTGYNYSTGIAKGIDRGKIEIEKAAIRAAKTAVTATSTELLIKSPSKVGERLGEFYDLGIAKGITGKEHAQKAAAEMAQALIESTKTLQTNLRGLSIAPPAVDAPTGDRAAGALLDASLLPFIAQPAGESTTNQTVNLGGITIHIDGAQVQNVDQLADKVADRLNQQIIRARNARGG